MPASQSLSTPTRTSCPDFRRQQPKRSTWYWPGRWSRRLTPENLLDRLGYVGRNKAPGLLFDLFCTRQVDQAALRAVLPGVWSGAEWPEYSLSRPTWLWWFELSKFPRPTEALWLYRGARPRYARGMAWTRDAGRAAWCAHRWTEQTGHVAHVYNDLALPEAVLADIDALEGDGGRSEGEVVVHPPRLPGFGAAPEIR